MIDQPSLNSMDFQNFFAKLQEFIAIQTIAGKTVENKRGVNFVSTNLTACGLRVEVIGGNQIEQPVIIARRHASRSTKKIVLYGHYDVAEVDFSETWVSSNPFIPEIIGDRLFGRGVADNKGTLLTRMFALNDLIKTGQSLPEILWLIQGKEEVNDTCQITRKIFEEQVAAFGEAVYLDETGFNDLDNDESMLFLWTKNKIGVPESRSQQLVPLASMGRVENRHLRKLNGGESCPFLNALPEDAIYLGFGPNDRLHNIHRANESLDVYRLKQHDLDFKKFMSAYAIQ